MLGMRDIGTTLSHCERAVFSDAFEEVSGLVIRFERKPTVMTVGDLRPSTTDNGALVTRMGIRQPAVPQIGLSLLATADGAAAIFTWLHYEEKCRAFAETLVGQPSDLLTTLLIQTCFEQIENTCMNIPWWKTLKRFCRKTHYFVGLNQELLGRKGFLAVCNSMGSATINGTTIVISS